MGASGIVRSSLPEFMDFILVWKDLVSGIEQVGEFLFACHPLNRKCGSPLAFENRRVFLNIAHPFYQKDTNHFGGPLFLRPP